MRTLDQERAAFAWQRLREGRTANYTNLAKSLPALVMTSGLMQTLAFLQGKAGNRGRSEHKELLEDILKWLADSRVAVLDGAETSFDGAMNRFTNMTPLEYQRATEETLSFLRWVRYLAGTFSHSSEQ
ncbi:MAG: type III-B CRISPR module-associated protein Cmr5 [Candidatus Dadabacteria bacterium]|nr:MAG: type III-B CRISPR module-associated protein Cmr5 [Candidatus Dadabacteria bacterium]